MSEGHDMTISRTKRGGKGKKDCLIIGEKTMKMFSKHPREGFAAGGGTLKLNTRNF